MNRQELVRKTTEKTEISQALVDKALGGILDTIVEAIGNGDSVQLTGFGTFKVGVRAAREGINPRTQEKIQIPATKTPKFRAGKLLKDAAAGGQK